MAISLFDLYCAAAWSTVVGMLVEVQVMLSLVWCVSRSWRARPATWRTA